MFSWFNLKILMSKSTKLQMDLAFLNKEEDKLYSGDNWVPGSAELWVTWGFPQQ